MTPLQDQLARWARDQVRDRTLSMNANVPRQWVRPESLTRVQLQARFAAYSARQGKRRGKAPFRARGIHLLRAWALGRQLHEAEPRVTSYTASTTVACLLRAVASFFAGPGKGVDLSMQEATIVELVAWFRAGHAVRRGPDAAHPLDPNPTACGQRFLRMTNKALRPRGRKPVGWVPSFYRREEGKPWGYTLHVFGVPGQLLGHLEWAAGITKVIYDGGGNELSTLIELWKDGAPKSRYYLNHQIKPTDAAFLPVITKWLRRNCPNLRCVLTTYRGPQ